MAAYRHLARIAVMQTLFAYEFRRSMGGELVTEEVLERCASEFEGKLKDLEFAKDLLRGILEKQEEIIRVLCEAAPQWPVERIAPVDRAILEIGIFEVLYSEDVPPIVAINEGVEVAKEYGDSNSAKFVNGVLSSVMHQYKKEKADANKAAIKKSSSPKSSPPKDTQK